LFSHDSDSMPRVWTGKEDIRAITKTARSAVCLIIVCCILSLYCISVNYLYELVQSLKLLSVVAAIRMDDDDNDGIEKTLFVALVDSGNAAVKDRSITTFDPLASSTWEEVIFGYAEVISSEVYKFLLLYLVLEKQM
jgi:hypothetical protein